MPNKHLLALAAIAHAAELGKGGKAVHDEIIELVEEGWQPPDEGASKPHAAKVQAMLRKMVEDNRKKQKP